MSPREYVALHPTLESVFREDFHHASVRAYIFRSWRHWPEKTAFRHFKQSTKFIGLSLIWTHNTEICRIQRDNITEIFAECVSTTAFDISSGTRFDIFCESINFWTYKRMTNGSTVRIRIFTNFVGITRDEIEYVFFWYSFFINQLTHFVTHKPLFECVKLVLIFMNFIERDTV